MPAADYADQDEDGGGEDVDQPGGANCFRHGATEEGQLLIINIINADQDDQDEDGGVQVVDSGGGEDDVD